MRTDERLEQRLRDLPWRAPSAALDRRVLRRGAGPGGARAAWAGRALLAAACLAIGFGLGLSVRTGDAPGAGVAPSASPSDAIDRARADAPMVSADAAGPTPSPDRAIPPGLETVRFTQSRFLPEAMLRIDDGPPVYAGRRQVVHTTRWFDPTGDRVFEMILPDERTTLVRAQPN